MLPVVPVAIFGADQPKIDLVYEFRRLQGMVLALPLHEVMRKPSQIRQYQREQFVFSLAVSFAPFMSLDGAYVTHIGNGLACVRI